MIKLDKQSIPPILSSNAVSWTAELQEAIRTGAKLVYRHNHPDIKNAVIADSFGKCIYCESKMLHVDWGEIEHIKPKTRFPEDAYNWENLGLVCAVCNNNKSDTYDDTEPFINPYTEDPKEFFEAVGAWLNPLPESLRGKSTINEIGLNREPLIETRKDKLAKLDLMIKLYQKAADEEKEAVLSEMRVEVSNDKQYSFIAKAYAASFGIEL